VSLRGDETNHSKARSVTFIVVVNKSGNTISLVDPATLRVVANVPTGRIPHEVYISPRSNLAYVTDYGDNQIAGRTLTVIDPLERSVVRTIDITYRRPHGVWVGASGRVYVTCEGDGVLVVLESDRVQFAVPTNQPGSHMVVVTPDERKAYITNLGTDTVTAIDLNSRVVVAQIRIGAGAEGIDMSPDGQFVFAAARNTNTLAKISVATDTVVATATTQSIPIRVKLTPNSGLVLVTNALSGTLEVFRASTMEKVQDVFVGLVPVGILVHTDDEAFVCATADHVISRIELPNLRVADRFTAGAEPDGLAYYEGWKKE